MSLVSDRADQPLIENTQMSAALDAVCRELCLRPADRALWKFSEQPDGLKAETLRCVLWALSLGGAKPVHTSSLLSKAERYLASVLGVVSVCHVADGNKQPTREEIRLAIRATLDVLELMLDFAQLRNGYWLPSPCRVVRLERATQYLLVGGAPSRELPADLREHLISRGCTRTVPSATTMIFPYVQSAADWSGCPSIGLEEWTKEILQKEPLSEYSEGGDRLEAYWPSEGVPQYYRWKSVADLNIPSSTTLLRLPGPSELRTYFLAEVRRRRVTRIGTSSLTRGSVRRLQYGLDLLAGQPTTARWVNADGVDLLTLNSALPHPEERLLRALGQLVPNADRKYYPLRWQVPPHFRSEVSRAIKALGVSLESNGFDGGN